MGQTGKFVLVALIGVIVVLGFLFFQTYTQKQMLTKELADVKREKSMLETKVKRTESQLRKAQQRAKDLDRNLAKINDEKKKLQKDYEIALRAKEELAKKLKSRQQEVAKKKTKPKQTAVTVGSNLPSASEDSYWAGVLQAKTDLEIRLNKISQESKNLTILNEQLAREKSTLELQINNLKREHADIKRQLEYNDKLMDSISQELVRERNDKMQIQDSFKLVKNENKVLIRQINGLNKRKISLEKQISEITNDKVTLVKQYDELEGLLAEKVSQVTELQEDLSALATADLDQITVASQVQQAKKEAAFYTQKSEVELEPIVVHAQPTGAPKPSAAVLVEGKVLAVNRENNFVVIDVGEEQGVQTGDIYQVFRNGDTIATIEAIQLRKNIAACDIREQLSAIGIGDVVR